MRRSKSQSPSDDSTVDVYDLFVCSAKQQSNSSPEGSMIDEASRE
jgi:hypothetical protein